MKKIILLAIVAIFSMTSCSTYNNMVTKDEAVKTAWSNISVVQTSFPTSFQRLRAMPHTRSQHSRLWLMHALKPPQSRSLPRS